ncbi:MAG: sensor histidine kinase [Phycisphaerales bacterium]
MLDAMTLSRNMAAKLAGLVLAVAALAGVTLHGLQQLQHRTAAQLASLEQWRSLHQSFVHNVATPIIEARLALDTPPPPEIPPPPEVSVTARRAADRAALALSQLAWPDDAPAELVAAARHEQRALAGIAWSFDARADLIAAYSLTAKIASQMRLASQAVTDQTQRQIAALLLRLSLLGGFIIVGAVALGVWQHRSVMRPLSQLTAGVRELAAGRFDRRVSERGPAELAALAAEFNQMADRLQQFYENLEQQVRDKSRQLAQAERLASVGYLAAGVAHEINNPLGIIAAHAELALRKMKDDDPAASALRIVVDEAFRCKQITGRLLSLSRGSRERRPVSLKALAEQTAGMVRQLPRAAGQSLIVELTDPLATIADASEIKQVLLNLLLNALDACSNESGRVTITGQRDGPMVELRITDNGRGMNPATLAKVFEPFYTEKKGTQASGELPGAGLGLSISHAIITEHAGELTAHSEGENRGAMFTLRLPSI